MGPRIRSRWTVLTVAVAVVAGILGTVVTLMSWTSSRGAAGPTGQGVGAGVLPPTVRVMPLGDSITWGVGSSSTSSYRAALADLTAASSRYTVQFVGSRSSGTLADPAHEGHEGFTIDQVRAGTDAWLAAARPDVVLLHIGINDVNRKIDPAGAPRRLQALVARILADRPTTTVLVLGLLPSSSGLEKQVAAFNASAAALLDGDRRAGRHIRFLEPPVLTATQMVDTLHPADTGYTRLAQVFARGLDQAFADGWVHGGARLGAGTEAGGAEVTGRVRLADMDGDGRADLVVLGSDGLVSVRVNRDGRGQWGDAVRMATGVGQPPQRVRLADMDGDRRADLVLVCGDGTMTVRFNRGGDNRGGWHPRGRVDHAVGPDVLLADLTGDGNADEMRLEGGKALSNAWGGGEGLGGWTSLGTLTLSLGG